MRSHITEYRVIYGDCDPFDVVYYAKYLDFFERGRTELFRNLGLTYRLISDTGVFTPVSETSCKYKKSAGYDDLLVIETTIAYMKRVKIRFDYSIYRKEPREFLAEGYTVHGFVNRDGKVLAAPEEVTEKVNEFISQE